jgi:hypothetical protein
MEIDDITVPTPGPSPSGAGNLQGALKKRRPHDDENAPWMWIVMLSEEDAGQRVAYECADYDADETGNHE